MPTSCPLGIFPVPRKRNSEPRRRVCSQRDGGKEAPEGDHRRSRGQDGKGVTSHGGSSFQKGVGQQVKVAQGASSHWELKSGLWDLTTMKYKAQDN